MSMAKEWLQKYGAARGYKKIASGNIPDSQIRLLMPVPIVKAWRKMEGYDDTIGQQWIADLGITLSRREKERLGW